MTAALQRSLDTKQAHPENQPAKRRIPKWMLRHYQNVY